MREASRSQILKRRYTPGVDECLILAAGNGRRLTPLSGGLPKPLVIIHGQPLLEHVVRGAHEAGINRFVIVIGYGADAIRDWFAHHCFEGMSVTLVENPEYHKDNGISVLKARDYLNSAFLLLMADHIFEIDTAKALLNEPLEKGEVILAVDSKLDDIFDLEDVTKLRRDGDHIVAIGKEIPEYDAYDTGMFLCSPEIFDVLEAAQKNGNCSLSDGMRMLGRRRGLRAFDIGDAFWQDVDTPAAATYTESIFDRRFCRPPRFMSLFALLLLSLVCQTAAFSQLPDAPENNLATIKELVTDPDGDYIPGAAVTVSGRKSSSRSQVTTGGDGQFAVDGFAVDDTYRVAVSSPGFAEWASPVIVLTLGRNWEHRLENLRPRDHRDRCHSGPTSFRAS